MGCVVGSMTDLALRSGSPRKRPAQAEDAMVPSEEAMEPLDGAPAWAVALQRNLGSQLDKVLHQSEELTTRVGHLEHRAMDDSARIQKLEEDMRLLKKAVESKEGNGACGSSPRSDPSTMFASPGPGVCIPPPSHLRDESDFNHLILGGWDQDTRRALIEEEVQLFIQNFKLADVTARSYVVGKRAWTAHLLLKPLPDRDARSRFFDLLPVVNKKMQLKNGKALWISPSKPFAVREKGKLLRAGFERLLRAAGLGREDETVEMDWNMAVVWIQGGRVMALDAGSLLAEREQKVIAVRFAGQSLRLHGDCHFNLSVIAGKLGLDMGELEAKLRSN